MQAIVSGDAEAFYQQEIAARKGAGLPPFGRLASIIVSAADRNAAEGHARQLRRAAAAAPEIQLLGPAEAALAMVRGRYRYRLLIIGSRRADLQEYIRAMLDRAPGVRGSVRVQIDIDPQSFL